MFCTHCGNAIADNSSFCSQCGKPQGANAATPTVVVKPAMSRGALIAVVAAVLFLPAIAFLGILAAIAIPAYQDYTQRAHVAQALSAAAPLKIAYAEHVADTGELPSDIGDLGYVPEIKPPLLHIALTEGLLVLQFDASLNDGSLALEPWLDGAGTVNWLCGEADLPEGATTDSSAQALTDANAADLTTIATRILPSSCR